MSDLQAIGSMSITQVGELLLSRNLVLHWLSFSEGVPNDHGIDGDRGWTACVRTPRTKFDRKNSRCGWGRARRSAEEAIYSAIQDLSRPYSPPTQRTRGPSFDDLGL